MKLRPIASLIALCLAVSVCGCGSGGKEEAVEEVDEQEVIEQIEETEEQRELDYTAEFIERFNSIAGSPLEVVETFDPHDESTRHYRHEFRLSAYEDSIGTYCTIGDLRVWIIKERFDDMRVYLQGPFDAVCDAMRVSTRVLSPDTPESEVDECINTVIESDILDSDTLIDSPYSIYFSEIHGKALAGEAVKENESKKDYYEALIEQKSYELKKIFSN